MQLLSTTENILLFIAGFGIMQGVLLSMLLYFHPRSNRSVNMFLALYIIVISLVMAGPFIIHYFSWQRSVFTQSLPLVAGPLLYLYIKSHRQKLNLQKILPHFVLFPFYLFASCLWVIYLGEKYNTTADIPLDAFMQPKGIIISAIPGLHLLLYYLLCRREVRKHQASIQHIFSETNPVSLCWVKWLLNGFLFMLVSALVICVLIVKFPEHFTTLYIITMAIATPYMYMTTYKSVTKSVQWLIQPAAIRLAVQAPTGDVQINAVYNPVRAGLSKPDENNKKIEELVSKIKVAMEQEKIYQEPDLTLQQIADKLQFPTYLVSQAINDGMNKSFYDLVNGYRVNEAKLLLLDAKNRNYTILSVGFEAGFNSKTTFNTVFKKFTGFTPTAYRAQQKELAISA